MSTNSTTLVGNLVDDPILRYTTTSRPVANCRIAVNDRINVNGQWQDRTSFFNVVVWNAMAENLAASASKGDRIVVSGRMQIREYNPTADTTTWYTELIADEVGLSVRWATVEGVVRNTRTVTETPADEPAADDADALADAA